jgi:hypothetical protein
MSNCHALFLCLPGGTEENCNRTSHRIVNPEILIPVLNIKQSVNYYTVTFGLSKRIIKNYLTPYSRDVQESNSCSASQ